MKKLTTLFIIAFMLTMGGVYAAWNYAHGNVANAYGSLAVGHDANIILAAEVTDNAKGTIAVDVSAVEITIDDANNDHKADITYFGNILVTFTPSAGATTDVTANGIPLKYSITTNSGWEYDGNKIFASTASDILLNEGNPITSITIPAAEWSSYLTFNGETDSITNDAKFDSDLTLDTHAQYTEFHNALHTNGGITITVSEYVAP